jgi:glycine oxidase
MQEYDIVIIGGGILAYATAFSILYKEPAIKVIIIIGKTDKGMATLASGAMLGCYGEITKNSLQHKPGRVKHEMAREATNRWPHWIEKIKEAAHVKSPPLAAGGINPGTFIVINNQGGIVEKENFSAIIKALKEDDEPYLEFDPCHIPGFNPQNHCEPLKSIYLPNEGTIDSGSLLHNLKTSISLQKNCTIVNEDVIKVYGDANQINQVVTERGKIIKGEKFLFAAGAYTQNLIDQVCQLNERVPPIFSGVGLSIVVDEVCPAVISNIRTPNRAGACGLHLLPKDDGSLYIGATNNIYLTPKYNAKLGEFALLQKSVIEQINQGLHRSNLLSYSVGNRSVTLDSFPLVGKTSLDNLWILSGTYRDGLHLSPVLSEIVACEMINENTSNPYHIFSPERTPIQFMTQMEAIDDTVEQYLSNSYEHGMKLPQNINLNMLKEMLYPRIQELYKHLNTEIAIPAELLMAFDVQELPFYLTRYLKRIEKN